MSRCTKKNCPMVGVSADCDLNDCPYRTETGKSKDTIYREDAIKALRKLGHEVVVIDKVCSLGVAAEFIDAIRAIPSADRPQGEWMDDDFVGQYRCSECDYYAIDEYDFCPNCGADMRGKDDEASD